MSHEPASRWDARWAFSHKEQTNYATALVGADFTRSLPHASDGAHLFDFTVQRIGGPRPFSGDEFARKSHSKTVAHDVRLALRLDAGSISLPWLAAFGMGQVTTSEPDAGVRWQHIIRFRPRATSQRARVTSIYEELASGHKHLVRSLAVNQITLSGNRRDRVALAAELIGAGALDTATAVTLPAPTPEQLFSGQEVKFEYGNEGGALTDISERLRSFQIQIVNEVLADEGYTIGSGKLRSRALLGQRRVAFEAQVEVDRANRDLIADLESDAAKEVKLTLGTGVTLGTGTYQAIFRMPSLRLSVAGRAEDGPLYAYRLQASEEIYKDDGIADTPLTITVHNNISAYFSAA